MAKVQLVIFLLSIENEKEMFKESLDFEPCTENVDHKEAQIIINKYVEKKR